MTIRIATIVFFLIAGIITNSAQAPSSSPVWNLSLPQGLMITSAVTVANKCSSDSRMKLESKDLKFLILPVEPVAIDGDRTVSVPVQFDTKALKPGNYEGNLTITCVTCGGVSKCSADRDNRKVVLNVTAAMGNATMVKGSGFDPKPVRNGESSAPINKAGSPIIFALRDFLKGPCPEREGDCDSLRRQAQLQEEEAKTSTARTAELQQAAAIARRNASVFAASDESEKATELRQKAAAAEFEAASANTAAAKAIEASEAALAEYRKCLLRVQEECRKKPD